MFLNLSDCSSLAAPDPFLLTSMSLIIFSSCWFFHDVTARCVCMSNRHLLIIYVSRFLRHIHCTSLNSSSPLPSDSLCLSDSVLACINPCFSRQGFLNSRSDSLSEFISTWFCHFSLRCKQRVSRTTSQTHKDNKRITRGAPQGSKTATQPVLTCFARPTTRTRELCLTSTPPHTHASACALARQSARFDNRCYRGPRARIVLTAFNDKGNVAPLAVQAPPALAETQEQMSFPRVTPQQSTSKSSRTPRKKASQEHMFLVGKCVSFCCFLAPPSSGETQGTGPGDVTDL